LAPPIAARCAGRAVDSRLLRAGALWWREQADLLVVEGAGGLLSPLTDTETNADLAVDLDFPLIVVARRTLGTINHSLLTLNALKEAGVRKIKLILSGVKAVDMSSRTNARVLAELCAPCPVFSIPFLGPKVVAIRVAVSFFFPLLAGWLCELVWEKLQV
jgi:dethiobiotin synthetase